MNDDDVAGDVFGEWVRPHLAAMAGLASRMAPWVDRDDIVQEALSRAWKKRDQFDPARGTPRVWLLAITADRARHAKPRPNVPLTTDPAQPDVMTDDHLDLERVVSDLPPRQRIAVDCYYYLDLSVAETAAVMGCAEGTVKSSLSDARKNIRRALASSKTWNETCRASMRVSTNPRTKRSSTSPYPNGSRAATCLSFRRLCRWASSTCSIKMPRI